MSLSLSKCKKLKGNTLIENPSNEDKETDTDNRKLLYFLQVIV